MHKQIIACVLFCLFLNSGCVVRTYPVTKERVDQVLTEGNRGYLSGAPAASEQTPRKTTRDLQVFELEFHPMKMEKKSLSPVSKIEKGIGGESEPEDMQVSRGLKVISAPPIESLRSESSSVVVMKKYTVGNGDTLQRISKKFYGTSRRWREIFEANSRILKSPHSIYPGQVIEVPVEDMSGNK